MLAILLNILTEFLITVVKHIDNEMAIYLLHFFYNLHSMEFNFKDLEVTSQMNDNLN